MNILFEKVFERDIDLLIINKFYNDDNLKDCFLNKIGLKNYQVTDIYHSLSDNNGESDITIILENDKEKIGLLIEDKIDSIAMPRQKERYDKRGNKGITSKLYDRYFVFIIAPKEYLDSNLEAKKYNYKLSYEEIREILKDDLYATSLIDKALEEKKKGYIVIENKNVTLFWNNYYDYLEKNYPKLKINRVEGPRGTNANWPQIKLPFNDVYIIHKSDRGYMDLTFIGKKNDNDLKQRLNNLLESDMSMHITGKSLAVRIIVPKIDFKKDFNDYLKEMKESLDAAYRLYDFSIRIKK